MARSRGEIEQAQPFARLPEPAGLPDVEEERAMRPHATTLEHVGEWKVSLIADTPEELFVELASVITRSVRKPRSKAGPWEPNA